jgi:hypothetical protein
MRDQPSSQTFQEGPMANQHQRPRLSVNQLCDGPDIIFGGQPLKRCDAAFRLEVVGQNDSRLFGTQPATMADLMDRDTSLLGEYRHPLQVSLSLVSETPCGILCFGLCFAMSDQIKIHGNLLSLPCLRYHG